MWEINYSERRRALRYKTRISCSISLYPAAQTSVEDSNRLLKFLGHTRDISKTGLGLLVLTKSLNGENLAIFLGRTLLIRLALPAESIKIHTKLVRYRAFWESELELGFVLGVQISAMSEPARAHYNEFLALARFSLC